MDITATQNIWANLLNWTYDRAVTGATGIDKAIKLAEKYSSQELTIDRQVDALINRQRLLAGSSGFITGLGGLLTLPLVIPANLISVVFIQLRMIAAIAYIGGYDLEDRKVKTLVLACLAGNAVKDIFQEIGIRFGKNVTRQMVSSISERSLVSINEKIGFVLLTRSGGKGLINISKAIPLTGGIIGASFDMVTTSLIGRIAKRTFIETV